MTTYNQAERYISDIPKFTTKNDLNHTKRFLEILGNPQKKRKIIHVAGTNGKGSVCIYLEHMLRSEKKTVGTFISPHLIVMNERIRINGQMVSDDVFLNIFDKTVEAAQQLQAEGLPHPTFFEFLFGMAMKAFAEANVEYVILETGLGGRLDATNCIQNPLLTLIASIGMDHMQYLGDTMEAIAEEKAGIIKPNVPVFYMENSHASVNHVFEDKARLQHAPCRKISKSAYEILENGHNFIAFSCGNAYYEDTTWNLPNIGIYQAINAMMALEAMRYLFEEDKHLDQWKSALADSTWEGRMEEVRPSVYVDGAHNMDAIAAFTDTMNNRGKNPIILFSAVEDKDYKDMIEYLCQNLDAEGYVVTTIEDERATAGETLGEIFKRNTTKPVIVIDKIDKAIDYVLENQRGREVFCLGSLYLVGTIKKYLGRLK